MDLKDYENVRDDKELVSLIERVGLFYLPPVVVIAGSLANVIALCIFRKQTFRSKNITNYISCFAIANLVYLQLLPGMNWVSMVTGSGLVHHISDELCRICTFLDTSIYYCRIWFAVVMVIDRYIALTNAIPGSLLRMILSSCKLTTSGVVVAIVSCSVHAMWLYTLTSGCFLSYGDDDVFPFLWQWISECLYSFIPLFLLAIFIPWTIFITVTVDRRQKSFQDGQDMTQRTENNEIVARHILTHAVLVEASIQFVVLLFHTIVKIVILTYPPSWLQNGDWITCQRYLHIFSTALQDFSAATLLASCIMFSKLFRKTVFRVLKTCHSGYVTKHITVARNSQCIELIDTSLTEDTNNICASAV